MQTSVCVSSLFAVSNVGKPLHLVFRRLKRFFKYLFYIYTKITEFNLSVFVYRPFREDLSPLLSLISIVSTPDLFYFIYLFFLKEK